MLSIRRLTASIGDTQILNGVDLDIGVGEVHAIMGPNGSGKSTLSRVIGGHPEYQVTAGTLEYEINLRPRDLLPMDADERAREGIFVSFQYPIEIPGVSVFAINDVTVKFGCSARVVSAAKVRLYRALPIASLLMSSAPTFERAKTSRL